MADLSQIFSKLDKIRAINTFNKSQHVKHLIGMQLSKFKSEISKCCANKVLGDHEHIEEINIDEIKKEIKKTFDDLERDKNSCNTELEEKSRELQKLKSESGQGSELIKQLQEANKTIERLKNELRDAYVEVDSSEEELDATKRNLNICRTNLNVQRNNIKELEAENAANKNLVTLYRAEADKFKKELGECKNKEQPFGIDEIIAPLDIFDADTVKDLSKTLDELIAQPKEEDQSEDEYQENKKYYGLLKILFNNTDKKLTEIYSNLRELVDSTMIGWSGIWLKLHGEKEKS